MYLTFYTCINNFDGIDITIAHAKKKLICMMLLHCIMFVLFMRQIGLNLCS